jgi:hypothetical protein
MPPPRRFRSATSITSPEAALQHAYSTILTAHSEPKSACTIQKCLDDAANKGYGQLMHFQGHN